MARRALHRWCASANGLYSCHHVRLKLTVTENVQRIEEADREKSKVDSSRDAAYVLEGRVERQPVEDLPSRELRRAVEWLDVFW